jgi:hypothetical protein
VLQGRVPTCVIYSGVKRFSRYLNWAQRHLGTALVPPRESLLPPEVHLDELSPEQGAFIHELLVKTGGFDDAVIVVPQNASESVMTTDAATALALAASQRDWSLGGDPRVDLDARARTLRCGSRTPETCLLGTAIRWTSTRAVAFERRYVDLCAPGVAPCDPM